MKKKNLPAIGFALALLLVLVVAAAIDYRALDATQFTTTSSVSVKSGATMTNIALYGSSTLLGSVVMSGLSESGTPTYPLFINPGASIVGWSQNGAVWTNLNASSIASGTIANARLPDPMTVGTVNATTLQLGQIKYATNGVADVTLIDLTKPYAHTNHTANFTITGFVNVDASGTNYEFATRCYTNNSVGAKTITLPAAWLDIGLQGNPLYNTNIGVLSVWRIPGFATNYLWVGK